MATEGKVLAEKCQMVFATWKYHQSPQALLLGSWILVWTLSSYNPTESQFGYSALIPLAGADSGYCNARPVDHRGREGVLHSILADMSLEI